MRSLPLPAAVSVLLCAPALAAPDELIHKLNPDDPASYDDFGRSVAIDGDRILIGSVGDDDNGTVSGSAYIFDAVTGQQLLKLLPDDGSQVDAFGNAVDIDGDLCIVGAYSDDPLGDDSGSAYVFDTNTGQQLYKLIPSDGAARDYFGASVAISGLGAIVGAPRNDHGGVTDAGAAFVFDLSTGQQLHKITSGTGQEEEQFGYSVDLDLFTAVIGAYFYEGTGRGSGRTYVASALNGSILRTLVPGDVEAGDFHGFEVEIRGDRALVSSPYDDDNASQAGAVYLYEVSTGAVLDKWIASDGSASDIFGGDLQFDGITAVVGAAGDNPNGTRSGSAYVFDVGTGLEIQKLVPPDGVTDASFGSAVAVHGSTIVCGAYHDDDFGKFSGSVYVFDECPSNLTLAAFPGAAFTGDALNFITSGGDPGRINALTVTDIGGSPTFFIVLTAPFAANCQHVFGANTPPSVSGLDISFQSLGFTPTGLQASNLQHIHFY